MINLEEIKQIIEHKSSLAKVEYSALDNLIEKYPFCSLPRIYKLYKLKAEKSIDFDRELSFHSIYIQDRAYLKSLLDTANFETITEPKITEPVVKAVEPEVIKEVETVIAEVKAETVEEVVEEIEVETVEDVVETIEPVVESKPIEKPIVAPKVEEQPKEEVPEQELRWEATKAEANLKILQSEYQSKLDSEPEIEKQEESAKEDLEEDFNLQIAAHAAQSGGLEWGLEEREDVAEVETPIESDQDEEIEEIETIEQENKEKLTFIDWLKTEAEKPRKKSVEPTISKEEIIDSFIDAEPRMSKPSKEFYKPQKSAKISLEDNADLVTETLAKIYELQGNYEKGIWAYEQLSLKFPKKKSFFAIQIQNLKQKLK